jgi:hypothetical protein
MWSDSLDVINPAESIRKSLIEKAECSEKDAIKVDSAKKKFKK